jgi:hypothetical protein
MAIQRFNAVGGYSTGITATAVIDSLGNITGVSGSFSGYVSGSTGFLFGPTSAFLQFIPATSVVNGGMWLKNGLFQIGGSVIGSGNGTVDFSPNTERFHVFGYADFNNSYNYQSGRAALRINGAPTQSVPIFAAYKQTSDGTQLAAGFSTTNMVAGIDQNGALFSNVGISASGATFAGNVSFQNAEFIRNTTNGRMDFMPAPSGSTHYGMYMDFTSWSYGVKLGTIRASDSALNAAGFLWEAPLTINGDVNFNLGSNGQNGLVNSTIGNNTNQFYTNTSSGENSGAFAIIDSAGVGAANRSPGVTHANPNLYVYRSGSARATDFIRMEHDGTNGRLVSGGTSGINLEPGSGSVGISGSITSVDGTFGGNVYTDNIFDNTGVLSINDKTNTRVAIGDYSSNANSTFIYLRDNISTLYISNPFGVISLGDPNGIDNSNVITYDAANATFSGNGLNSLDGFQTISADSTILENNRRVTTNARSWFL